MTSLKQTQDENTDWIGILYPKWNVNISVRKRADLSTEKKIKILFIFSVFIVIKLFSSMLEHFRFHVTS